MSIDIEKLPCTTCNQDIVVDINGQLARHRHPAPRHNGKYIFNKGQMVLGKWCKGSGVKVK